MKIKKQWLVYYNNCYVHLIKTNSKRYFVFEETNKSSFVLIEKDTAKKLISDFKNKNRWLTLKK